LEYLGVDISYRTLPLNQIMLSWIQRTSHTVS
jgi:hypothetical protein